MVKRNTVNAGVKLKVLGLRNKEKLTETARKLGLSPADVLEAFGHPNELQDDFRLARETKDRQSLWSIFQRAQKGSSFAKKVLHEILKLLDGPEDVPEMWHVYHLSSGECDLADEILHKINQSTNLLQNWMDVIRHSKSGESVHEEAIRFARMATDSRDVLWTLFRATENYALRKSILGKILMASRSTPELMQVLRVAEHGYPETRNRCLQKLVQLGMRERRPEQRPQGETKPAAVTNKTRTGVPLVTRPLSRATTVRSTLIR